MKKKAASKRDTVTRQCLCGFGEGFGCDFAEVRSVTRDKYLIWDAQVLVQCSVRKVEQARFKGTGCAVGRKKCFRSLP